VTGCVSGLSNALPELVSQSLAQALAGSTPASGSAAERLAEVARRIPAVLFPLDVAACMEARGLPIGSPKTAQSASTRAKYDALVTSLRELFREWNLP
jgi:dihydrodipicolinate synthase/N-acetylneuraminate lyase